MEPYLDGLDASDAGVQTQVVHPGQGADLPQGRQVEAEREAVWYGKKPYADAPQVMENLRGVGLVCRDKKNARFMGVLRSRLWERLGKSLVWSLAGWCMAVGVLWTLSEKYRISVPMVGSAAAAVASVQTVPKPLATTPFSRIQAVIDTPPIPDWGRYEVLIGSFVDPLQARRLHRQVLATGNTDYWRSAVENGQPRIQVLVGPFAKGAEAERKAKDLRERLGVEARILILQPAQMSVSTTPAQTLQPPSERSPTEGVSTVAVAVAAMGGEETIPLGSRRRH
ncbi:MAG: SPOR domain-containing protein [Magnetococcales bacterium]|nr:SPOR domain-containing protein [Magnetococcales bacterium]